MIRTILLEWFSHLFGFGGDDNKEVATRGESSQIAATVEIVPLPVHTAWRSPAAVGDDILWASMNAK